MHFIPTLWIVWAVFAVCLLSLLLYRGTITRYETICTLMRKELP